MSDTRASDLAGAERSRDDNRISNFGDARAEARAALGADAVFDLQHLALIEAAGDEAEDFLQGQLTNDVREVTAGRAQLSAWCSPRGRVLTCLLVFRHDGRLLLQLPETLLESTLARMRMYLLRAKATLENASASWMRIGVVGEAAASRLSNRFGGLPETPDDVHGADGLSIIRLRGRRPRYQIVGTVHSVTSVWNDCRSVALAAGADAWELLDIDAGLASIGPATADAFVPQMINFDRIGGVSFTKGCYVGQEIVARSQHLGRIKRRMMLAHWDGSVPIGAGDTLQGPGDPASLKAQVVNAAAAPAGGFDILAVLPVDAAAEVPAVGATLADGSRLTLNPLPYSMDDGSP